MEKRWRLVHAIELGGARNLSMLVGLTSPPPHPSTSVNAPMMAIVMPMAIRGSPLRPHSLANVFTAIHHGGGRLGGNLGGAPLFRPATINTLVVVHAASTNLLVVDDILSPLVVASIATPVASPPIARVSVLVGNARVSVLVGNALLEGILPPSFFL